VSPHRHAASPHFAGALRIFTPLDSHLWALCYKWGTFRHADKPKKWIVARYFGKYNKFRNDHWVFGDATSGAHLRKLSWTGIVRHTMVKGTASPDDPALTEPGSTVEMGR
jgi:RNA-directed DNA polymerase